MGIMNSNWTSERDSKKYKIAAADIKDYVLKFKMELLKNAPFYGDILMKIQFVEDDSIPTAATNGKKIFYNKKFLAKLKTTQINYVIMHELFHVLLMHWKRSKDLDAYMWNIACDYVVNSMIDRLVYIFKSDTGIVFERPPEGIFGDWGNDLAAEDVYQKILSDNKQKKEQSESKARKFIIRSHYSDWGNAKYKNVEMKDFDIIFTDEKTGEPLSDVEQKELENMVKGWIKESMNRNQGMMSSRLIPNRLLKLVQSKKLPWYKLLNEYLELNVSDESSYLTPERKYLHMDLIVPGAELKADELGDIWAFIDSSGSIGNDDMNQFVTQLCRIAKEFECDVNIGYWDTSVTDVYTKVKPKKILECTPHHSGGTDVGCVYKYLNMNHIKSPVILILTDGYFSQPREEDMKKYQKNTILVLTENNMHAPWYKQIGKIVSL